MRLHKTTFNRQKLAHLLVSSCFILTASSIATAQNFVPQPVLNYADPFEPSQALHAADFLGAENLQSAYHSVDPQALTNGMATIYNITSADGVARITGADAAFRYIKEVEATEMLRARPTLNMIGKSAFNRTTNLVRTPLRTLNSIGESAAEIETLEEAILFIPTGVGQVGIDLIKGVGELGFTVVRVANKAANAKCQGLGACLEAAGDDIWSGLNALVGKNRSSRRIHKSVGTNFESRNKVLQKQVDRLSYAEVYTGTAYKFALANAGIDILSDYQSGIGWFNNGESVVTYEDRHRGRVRDKASLESWGLTPPEIDTLYRNTTFTDGERARLVAVISKLDRAEDKARLAREVIDFNSPYLIEARLQTYDYLVHLSSRGELQNFAPNAPAPIIVTSDQTYIFPVSADYLQWSPQTAAPLDYLTQIEATQNAEIHVIGSASERFKQVAQRRGIKVLELN